MSLVVRDKRGEAVRKDKTKCVQTSHITWEHMRPIEDAEIVYILQAMRFQKPDEECLELLKTLIEPYTFTSSNVLSILKLTNSSNLRMALLEHISPRIIDPEMCMNEIIALFPLIVQKCRADSMLRKQAEIRNNIAKLKPVIPPLPLYSIRSACEKQKRRKTQSFLPKILVSSSSSETSWPVETKLARTRANAIKYTAEINAFVENSLMKSPDFAGKNLTIHDYYA